MISMMSDITPQEGVERFGDWLGKPSKKYYLDREIVPIPSDTPTIETVSEYLDSEYW